MNERVEYGEQQRQYYELPGRCYSLCKTIDDGQENKVIKMQD